MNPPAILDPVIMTLSNYYQEASVLEPLDADPDKNGAKSDHMIVIIKPINVMENKSVRQTRTVKVRPFPQSGLANLKEWFIDQSRVDVYNADSAHKKAETFQTLLINKLNEIFPVKVR